jgi:hypothetical protein
VNKLICINLVRNCQESFCLCVIVLIRFLFLFPVNIIRNLCSNSFFIISDLSHFDSRFCKICYRL